MANWEEKHLMETECRFPKYRSERYSWYQVIQRDRDYVQWILDNVEDLDDDLRDALEWGVTKVPDAF